MITELFDNEILYALRNVNLQDITEIRVRVDKPLMVYIGNQGYFLGENGLYNNSNYAIVASEKMIDDIVFRASSCSLYSINEQLKKGFISLKNGIRIGVCGDVITENNETKTITNFSSLNIRIPHQVKNCSLTAFKYLYVNGKLKNTLIISPAGAGKTTFIRDLCYQLSENDVYDNICILDERGEISPKELTTGNYSDVISFCNKTNGFEQALRTMTPKIIVVDELNSTSDVFALEKAFNCGVNIVATIHGESLENIKLKKYMSEIINKQYFERYVVLSTKNGVGTIDAIYNQKFIRIGLGDL